MRIGYLCSEFPALSHTFISREIRVLEGDGFDIRTCSINPVANPEKFGPTDRAYAEATYYIKAVPMHRIAALLVRGLFQLPRFASVLAYAWRLNVGAGPRDVRKALGYFAEAVLLRHWARSVGVSHIHVHFANPAATVALIAARFGGLSYSLSVHGPDEFYDVAANLIKEKVEGAVFVRCISYYCRSQLMRLTPYAQWKKFRIVRCGIFADEFPPRAPTAAGPQGTMHAREILCVGRLCPSKGQAVLVEAAKILADRGQDFHLRFLGGGEDLDTIRALVERLSLETFVSVEGPVAHQRVKEALAACDLFVLPSFAEGIPVALMEAMAAGIPVVSTGIMGIPELIEHEKSGVLTQPSNAAQLADALEACIDGRIDTARLTEAAAAKVRADFDAARNTRELAEHFRVFLEAAR